MPLRFPILGLVLSILNISLGLLKLDVPEGKYLSWDEYEELWSVDTSSYRAIVEH